MDEADPGHHLEQLTGEMLRGSSAGRPVVEVAGVCFRVGDELGKRLCGKRRAHRHDIGEADEAPNRYEIADEVEAKLLEECCIYCVHGAAEDERVAVGGGSNGRLGGEIRSEERRV